MESMFMVTWAIMMLVGLATTVFWIIELVDCLKSDFKGPNDKLIWILVLILAGPLGALIYFFIGKKQKAIPTTT